MRAVLPSGEGSSPLVGELADPAPGAGEVLVRVAAAGLNRADLFQLRGEYPPPAGESSVPGLECAGTVVAHGPGVSGWPLGSRVMALLGGGGQAELAAVPTGQLMALPEALSFPEGGAVPEAALTAWTNLVVEGKLQTGETVLVTGATGGVGSFTVQLARELGARVFASARNRDRLARLGEVGIVDLVADGPDLAGELRRATAGRGIDLVLDLVGGAALPRYLAGLRPGGRLILLGALGGERAEIDAHAFLSRRLKMIGSTLRFRPRSEKKVLVAAFAAVGIPLLASGRLRAIVDRVVPLAQAAAAYRALENGEPFGKIVLDCT
jgi:putative PIG3 family NAD(P)H quinone oxidoreductase